MSEEPEWAEDIEWEISGEEDQSDTDEELRFEPDSWNANSDDTDYEKEEVLDTAREIEDQRTDWYVYVLEMERLTDESTWYYVGETKNLRNRILSHFSTSVRMSRYEVAIENGYQVYTNSHEQMMIRSLHEVEKIVLPDEVDQDEYVKNRERRKSYEVAIEEDTTHVIGGK